MHLRRTALTTTAALAAALLAPSAWGAPSAGATAPTGFSAAYACVDSISRESTAVPVAATVTATRTSPTEVALAVSAGQLDLPVESEVKDVRLTSTMATAVDGVATTVTGSSTVTLRPGSPADYPVARGVVASTATTLRLTPGALRVTVGLGIFTATIDCTVQGSAPTVTVPVTDPNAPTPAPDPEPAPAPDAAVKARVKVSLTKKVQRVGGTPARAKVSVARPSSSSSRLAGRVQVRVGKKKLTARKVRGATTFRIALPRRLKPGRHKVTVVFQPGVNTSGYVRTTASARVRVRR